MDNPSLGPATVPEPAARESSGPSEKAGAARRFRDSRVRNVVPESPTLAINRIVGERRLAGKSVLNLGFGEAGLNPLPAMVEQLARHASASDYRPSAGGAGVREAAAGYWSRRRLPTQADDIVVGPGSKAVIFATLAGLEGAVILPRPSWVSYAPQANLLGRRVVYADVSPHVGGIPDPVALSEAVTRARNEGVNARILVVTIPDNPTGTAASRADIEALCRVCEEHELTVISDEIYRDLYTDPTALVSPAELLPAATIVTCGMSKNLSVGGWRVGFARYPANDFGEELRRAVCGVASEVWSGLASPMEEAATWALAEPPEVTEWIAKSRALHLDVVGSFYEVVERLGIDCRRPTAAYYLYPRLDPMRHEGVRRLDIVDDAVLAAYLLDNHGVATLPGSAFGDIPARCCLRIATSLLYGTGEQRDEALESSSPRDLPQVVQAREQFEAALRFLV